MKYPLEKRRPSTHHERLHREIALILETRYNDPHSGGGCVDTNADADAWYNMLSKEDQHWIRDLFRTEIYNGEQSDRDRIDLLNTLCRWDCDMATKISIHLWKNLPVESNLQLQEGIAYGNCLPYTKDVEDFLLSRFSYWEKKLFLYAERMEWTERTPASEVAQGIANIVALNSFSIGLHIYPRCIILAHRGVFDDIRFLAFLTRTVPIARLRDYPAVSKENINQLRRYLAIQDPQYLDYLKRRQKDWTSLGEPLKSLIADLDCYTRKRPTAKLKSEILTQLRQIELEHDELRINSAGEFELVMTKTLKNQREQIESQIPFMTIGANVLAKELLAPTAEKLLNGVSNCHLVELAAINADGEADWNFVIRFELAKD